MRKLRDADVGAPRTAGRDRERSAVTWGAPAQQASPWSGQAGPARGTARRGSWSGQAGPARNPAPPAAPAAPAFERLTLVTELRNAIEQRALDVVFQPQLRLGDGSVAGVEALVRWDHVAHGAIPPETFVQMAEHTGLIDSLTDLVLERALEQAGAWTRDAGATVAINVSVRSLRRAGFPERVRARLAAAGVAPAALVLETTEGALANDHEHTLHNLERLRAAGVGLSIDDLGTGQSSLASLRRLPVTEIKVDRSFVSRLAPGSDEAAIVGTIVQLGHRLGMRVVADGVASEQAWHVLRRLGCDLAQGDWIRRPGTAAEVDSWLRARNANTGTRGGGPALPN